MTHTCHWPGCETSVPPSMWGCRPHWFSLPKVLRKAVWATYRPGQEITKDPSEDYLRVVGNVTKWILEESPTYKREQAKLAELQSKPAESSQS